MTTIDLSFNAPQYNAHKVIGPRHTAMLGWGRGTGKSTFLRTECWLAVAAWDGKRRESEFPFTGLRIAWLMPSRKQFVDVHGAAILDELGPTGTFGFLKAKINRTTWQIEFPGGSTLIPFPASEYNSKAARGIRADILIVDECDDVGGEVYDAVAVPWLSANWSLGIEILAGTPTRGRHGLWWRMMQQGRLGAKLRKGDLTDEEALALPEVSDIAARFDNDPDQASMIISVLKGIHSFHATYRDTPETVSLRAVAKARATTLPATFEREWEANPDAGEGLVYPFDEEFHVRPPPPMSAFGGEFLVGCDWGWGTGVLVLAGVQGNHDDATLWILDEWYEGECPNHIWDERAKAWEFATFYADPSRPDRIDTLRNLGIRIHEADNNVFGGIARVADMVFRRKGEDGEPDWARMYVAPRCKNVIKEFGLYRRKKLPDGTFDEHPEKKWDHAMDSIRYLSVGRFGRGPNYRTVGNGR